MGTIAQKLEYLNDTRLLLKDNINKINNVLTDQSTFRSYPQELFNGYLDILNNGTDTLWSNLEKVSQTGTEAVLENVETAPIKMVLNGNTSQDGEPTPDTPVEVKVVKGENVVSISGENQSDKTDYPISLGTLELCKINTYKDYFHKDSGSWYVHKEIGKVVFDENTIFESYQSFGNYYRGQKKIQDAKIFENNNIEIFSNYFKGNINVFTSTKAEVGNMGQYKNTIDFYFISTQPTQADFKTWLSTHNTIFYYVLATPTEEEITNTTLISQLEAIYKAKSVKDKTYITQTNDNLPFILDVEAIKEYEVN